MSPGHPGLLLPPNSHQLPPSLVSRHRLRWPVHRSFLRCSPTVCCPVLACFFVQFHELLFPPDTWTFSSTSGLIRLYPQLFWYRVGLAIIGRIMALGSVTTITSFYLASRAEQKPPSSPYLSLPFTLERESL